MLALTCHIELFTQSHYQQSIDPQDDLSPLWKDVFKFHWIEEVQHAMLDELEWVRENSRVDAAAEGTGRRRPDRARRRGRRHPAGPGRAPTRIISCSIAGRRFNGEEEAGIRAMVLRAYRWQYIVSGVQHPHFGRLLTSMTTDSQMQRIQSALAPIMARLERPACTQLRHQGVTP